MTTSSRPLVPIVSGLILVLTAASISDAPMASRTTDQQAPDASAIISQDGGVRADFDWGSLYTYFEGESYGTRDGLAAVAEIKPGQQIHPPHVHAEEEYLMVLEGEGTWSLLGEEQPAKAGDMLYASPWEEHGITNTGATTMKFVVWKWNNKGVPLPAEPGSSG